jgi:hypothetical protein
MHNESATFRRLDAILSTKGTCRVNRSGLRCRAEPTSIWIRCELIILAEAKQAES